MTTKFNNWYRLTCAILSVYVRVCVDEIITYGQEHLFKGPKILVGNHPNASDGLCLPSVIPEHLHFAVQAEIFTLPIVGLILKRAEQIPVSRGKGQDFVQRASEILERGFPVVVFPEGKLNMNTGLNRARTGAAALALNTGVPLVPFGFYAPEQNIRIIRKRFYGRNTIGGWQFGGKLFLQFGQAFQLDPAEMMEDTRESLRSYTQTIMQRIEVLANQARSEAIRLGMVRSTTEAPASAGDVLDRMSAQLAPQRPQNQLSYQEAEDTSGQTEIHLPREK